jgi:hypothetical protein
MKIQVLTSGENTWSIDGAPLYFETFEAAGLELDEHFADMVEAGMDYEPADYQIEVLRG